MKETLSNANFPRDSEGRVYHLGIRHGEVANRILTVGDHARAKAIARWLDTEDEAGAPVFLNHSHRGFLTITGRYKGVPVSIMAIGMGNCMMDFFVRETRAVTTGTLAIIRFGSCGSLSANAPAGTVVVPRGGYCIRKNLEYFVKEENRLFKGPVEPYQISGVFDADKEISQILAQELEKAMAPISGKHGVGGVVADGLNADGCSFYSSQGRKDPAFWDDNEHVIQQSMEAHPDTVSLEMETSMLFHLAECAREPNPIRAAGCMQVFADRVSNGFIHPDTVAILEPTVGKSCLETLIKVQVDNEMTAEGTVWEKQK
ncbi:nucleoside phosphorylase domain-containing protein [Umbelopsis sp. AD052]|nr:nucleoside phosphorylase domain-containing protein [Umbelopsis sp. AD052]